MIVREDLSHSRDTGPALACQRLLQAFVRAYVDYIKQRAGACRRTARKVEDEYVQAAIDLIDWLGCHLDPGTLSEGAGHEIDNIFIESLVLPERLDDLEPHGLFHLTVTDLAAIWARTRCSTTGFYRYWRERRKGAEHRCLFNDGCSALLGENAPWSSEDRPELTEILLETAASLLLQEDYLPAEDVAAIDPRKPLRPQDYLALVAYKIHAASPAASGGSECSPETVVSDLGELLGLGRTAEDRLRPDASIQGAIALWAANSAFFSLLVRKWRWLRPIDFMSRLDRRERESLRKTAAGPGTSSGSMHLTRLNPEVFDLSKPVRWNPGVAASGEPTDMERELLEPVPLGVIAPSSAGKTSMLMGIMRKDELGYRNDPLQVIPGRVLQVLDERFYLDWLQGAASSTETSSDHALSIRHESGRPAMSVALRDYNGVLTERSRFSPEQEQWFLSVKGMAFMLDDRSLVPGRKGEEDARERIKWYVEQLRRRAELRPSDVNPPVALVINKADLLLGDDFDRLERFSLLDDATQTELFSLPLASRRLPNGVEDPGIPLARLRACVLDSPANNVTARVRDLVERIFDRCGPLCAETLRVTYRFQIFLTCSIKRPGRPESKATGVIEPLRWFARHFYAPYLREARHLLVLKRNLLNNDRKEVAEKLSISDKLRRKWQRLQKRKAALTAGMSGNPLIPMWLQNWRKQRLESLETALSQDLGGLLDQCASQLGVPRGGDDPAPFLARRTSMESHLETLTSIVEALERLIEIHTGNDQTSPEAGGGQGNGLRRNPGQAKETSRTAPATLHSGGSGSGNGCHRPPFGKSPEARNASLLQCNTRRDP